MAVQEDHDGRQPVIVVNNELQVGHSLIALICQGGMLSANCVFRVVHLVHDVRNVTQVDVQPRRVLQAQQQLIQVPPSRTSSQTRNPIYLRHAVLSMRY